MSIHAIPGHFPLPRIKTNLNSDEFSFVRVGAYLIRPTDGHASGRMDRKIAIFQVARVGRNSIRPTNGHARGRMKRKIAIFQVTRVGRNSIRPTDDHAGGRIDRKIAIFPDARVGDNSIRPTDGHAGGRMKLIRIRFLIHRIKTGQNPDKFSAGRVRAY